MLVEYWTDSRRAVVLCGSPTIIDEIVAVLELPATSPIQSSPTRAMLGLWGTALTRYVEEQATGSLAIRRRWISVIELRRQPVDHEREP